MKTYTDELTPVDSATAVFGGANWPEREVCVCVCVCLFVRVYVCVCGLWQMMSNSSSRRVSMISK